MHVCIYGLHSLSYSASQFGEEEKSGDELKGCDEKKILFHIFPRTMTFTLFQEIKKGLVVLILLADHKKVANIIQRRRAT